MMDFPDRIKYCAAKVGSGNELSRRTGISRATVASWLQGITEPRLSYLAKVSSVCQVSAEWLVTGEGTPEGDKPQEKEKIQENQSVEISKRLHEKATEAIAKLCKQEKVIITTEGFAWYSGLVNDLAATVAEKAESEREEALLFDVLSDTYLEKIRDYNKRDDTRRSA